MEVIVGFVDDHRDISRRIIGWRVAAHMRTEMVLDALEMARRSRGSNKPPQQGLETNSPSLH